MSPATTSDWDELVGHAIRLGPDCFIATVTPDGDPHLSMVSPGYHQSHVIVATWARSVKARNLGEGARTVMFHWVVKESTGNDMLLMRGEARSVHDAVRGRELWESDCLPYDPADYYEGQEDPDLLWVEITPTYASLERSFGEGERTVWRF